jgi:hypothetical protein
LQVFRRVDGVKSFLRQVQWLELGVNLPSPAFNAAIASTRSGRSGCPVDMSLVSLRVIIDQVMHATFSL